MEKVAPKPNDFSTGLCDCGLDVTSCVETCFCPYCQLSAQYNMVSSGQSGVHALACCGMCCLDSCFCFGIAWLAMNCYVRCEVRKKYAIPSADCEDFCCGIFFPGCMTCQNYRELSIRGNWPGGLCVSPPQHTMPMGTNSQSPQMNTGPVMGQPIQSNLYPAQQYNNSPQSNYPQQPYPYQQQPQPGYQQPQPGYQQPQPMYQQPQPMYQQPQPGYQGAPPQQQQPAYGYGYK